MKPDLICEWLGLPAGTWPPDHYRLLGPAVLPGPSSATPAPPQRLPPPPQPTPPPAAAESAELVDPVIAAAQQSSRARRGLGTKRALYARVVATRKLLRVWERLGI